jgi:hypothetical protein
VEERSVDHHQLRPFRKDRASSGRAGSAGLLKRDESPRQLHRMKADISHRQRGTSISVHMAHRSRASLFVLACLILPGFAAGQSTIPADQQAAASCAQDRPVPPLPATAEQVAGEIGVLPLVQRVRALAICGPPAGGISIEELSSRQQIIEAVVAASLDVDEVIASISFEQAQITEVEDRLTNAKNKKVNTLTLESIIVGSGSSGIGNAMGFSRMLKKISG